MNKEHVARGWDNATIIPRFDAMDQAHSAQVCGLVVPSWHLPVDDMQNAKEEMQIQLCAYRLDWWTSHGKHITSEDPEVEKRKTRKRKKEKDKNSPNAVLVQGVPPRSVWKGPDGVLVR